MSGTYFLQKISECQLFGIVSSDAFNLFVKLSFDKLKKVLDQLCCLRFLLHEMHRSVSSAIINNCQKILLSIISGLGKWSPYITVNQIKRKLRVIIV